MTIEQFIEYNRQGKVPQDWIGQGSGYKNFDFDWENGNEKDIIYIPEYAYGKNDEYPLRVVVDRDDAYSKTDFIEICDGNEDEAQYLFDACDWQFPESLYAEFEQESEVV